MSQYDVIIIGAGFGGLCMAHKLKEAGYDNILILEKADEVGGTWRENTYPGAECDIPSVLYSYSFAPNPSWDFKWAKQKQIFEYVTAFASDNDLRRHIRFGITVSSVAFDGNAWSAQTDQGEFTGRFLVSAIGQLHVPKWPNIPGRDGFAGDHFHSAQWNHDVDLTGKNVGVIGVGASAAQLIPEVAKIAAQTTVYQRSPNWVIDKGDRPYTRIEQWIGKRFPSLQKLYRFSLWCLGEYVIYPIIRGAKIRAALARAKNRSDMKKHIKNPEMRAALTPNFPIGAKRILFSGKYYEALARDNVELVTAGIEKIDAGGIMDADGTHRAHEAIVFATGFHTNPFLKNIDVKNSRGETLKDHWKDGAFAYHGVTTSGFPNLFFLYGPNTNTGHTSIIFKLEQQVGYIIKLIRRAGGGSAEVSPEAEAEFSDEMQSRLSKLAWAKVEASWYKDGEKVTNNWPGTGTEFKRRFKTPIWEHFEFSGTDSSAGDT